MVYLIYGNDQFIMEKTVSKELTKVLETPDALNYSKYDNRTSSLTTIMADVDYLPLGVNKKVVLVDYTTIFDKKNALTNKEEDELVEFIKSQREDIYIFFIVRSSVNKKQSLVKLIENHGKIVEIKDISKFDWPKIVTTLFKKADCTIDSDAIDLLVEYTQGNTMNLYNEVEKLTLFKTHINREDVVKLVARPFEESLFELANALVRNDKALALQIYRDFLVLNIEPLTFIVNLANQFRLYAMVFLLLEQRLTKDEIATNLAVHPYRIQLAIQMRNKLKLDEIYSIIDKLHELDYKIKSGQIDRFYAFEMFIINY